MWGVDSRSNDVAENVYVRTYVVAGSAALDASIELGQASLLGVSGQRTYYLGVISLYQSGGIEKRKSVSTVVPSLSLLKGQGAEISMERRLSRPSSAPNRCIGYTVGSQTKKRMRLTNRSVPLSTEYAINLATSIPASLF